jgi:hypothetical protein
MLSNPSQYSPQGLMPQFPQFANSQFGNDNPFGAGALATNPYLQNQLWQSPVAHNPLQGFFAGQAGAHIPVQQIVPVLGVLAQQIAVQSAVAQQIGAAVHQLAHQLAVQGLQGYPAGGLGAGPAFAGAGQPYLGGAQPFGQPFGPSGLGGLGAQGAYGGFNPQAQAWGANRPQTIQ